MMRDRKCIYCGDVISGNFRGYNKNACRKYKGGFIHERCYDKKNNIIPTNKTKKESTKEQRSRWNRTYYIKNIEESKRRSLEYYYKNIDKMKKIMRERMKKTGYAEYMRKYRARKRETDDVYRVKIL